PRQPSTPRPLLREDEVAKYRPRMLGTVELRAMFFRCKSIVVHWATPRPGPVPACPTADAVIGLAAMAAPAPRPARHHHPLNPYERPAYVAAACARVRGTGHRRTPAPATARPRRHLSRTGSLPFDGHLHTPSVR